MDLTDLRDDGDTVDLADGRTLRLRIEVDQDASVEDADCYGMIGWSTTDPDTGYQCRPSNMNGSAEILRRDFRASLWWQPPADIEQDSRSELRNLAADLCEYGFKGVILELCEGEDHYGAPIVRDSASLWGLDSLENGFLLTVVGELWGELNT